MRNSLLKLSLALAAFAPLGAHANQLTYEAVADFSLTPTGPWSYGYGTTTSFTGYTVNGTSWAGSGYEYVAGTTGGLPVVGYNNHNNVPTGGLTTVYVPPTELWLHPGSAATGEDTIVRFIAPVSGSFDLLATWTRDNLDNGGNGVVVNVLDGAVLLKSHVIGYSLGTTYSYGTTLNLAAGDVITFDLNNNGNYGSDSTGFDAVFRSVSAVPEPSSLALLSTGILGMAGAVRRRLSK